MRFIEKKYTKSVDESVKRLKNTHLMHIDAILFLLIIGLAILGYFIPYNGLDLRQEAQLIPPCWRHLFGTDPDGRDMFIRVIIGIKAYFFPGVMSVCISTLLGTILGIFASSIHPGIWGRVINFFTRCTLDAIESFPKYIVLLLLITIIPEPTFYHLMLALGVLNSSKLGKMVMNKIESLRKRHFIEAAEALGLKRMDIIFRHILFYNCFPIFIIQASLQMAEVILLEIGLNYLGFISKWGLCPTIPEPFPSWGNILIIWMNHIESWWMALCPLLIITLNILILYSIGDRIIKNLDIKHNEG